MAATTPTKPERYGICYRASWDAGEYTNAWRFGLDQAEGYFTGGDRWRPSIHMPRWASRIQLVVKDVRVERVQEISEEDARAEGAGAFLEKLRGKNEMAAMHLEAFGSQAVFGALWNQINEKRGFGWDENPWVWVVSFEVKGEVRRTDGEGS